MDEDYDWGLIRMVALPFALAEAYIFYTNISDVWKWLLLVAGMVGTGAIVYTRDKKKHNIFTAVGVVFLAAVIVRFMKVLAII